MQVIAWEDTPLYYPLEEGNSDGEQCMCGCRTDGLDTWRGLSLFDC